jgi:DMSO/TMAO reductase YedYZ molybdopterin-dependent catalytic subunit
MPSACVPVRVADDGVFRAFSLDSPLFQDGNTPIQRGDACEAPMDDDVKQQSEEEAAGTPTSAPLEDDSPAHGAVRYSRRRVLVLGGAFVAGVAAVIAGLRALGGPSEVADKVGGPVADQFGTFPVRSVEDVPDVPPEQWVVKVDGLVETPLTVDHTMWAGLPRVDETVDFHCVEGWGVDDVRWGGVAPAVILDQAGVMPAAKYAVFYAYGDVYLSSVPLELVRDSQTLLADTIGGAPLPAKHGGPLRLVVPRQLGYKSVKWVERIELTDKVRTGYWESRGYPEDAPV